MKKCGLHLLLITLTILLFLSPSSADAAVWGAEYSFYYPLDVAVYGSGNVYVADSYNNRIQVFTSAGTFKTKWGSYGTGNGQFYRPSGIAVDAAGNVYVADYYKNRIQVFTSAGTFKTKWGSYGTGDGQFYRPFGIAVDAAENVYVADSYNNRIQVFTSAGTFKTKWGSYGTGNGQFDYPYGIVVDAAGNVYVADSCNNRIQVFEELIADSDGDGVPDDQDSCQHEDSTGFDANSDGCIDSLGGLITVVNTLVNEGVISPELKTSLLTKAENSQKSATKENFCAAVNELKAFQNQIEAQGGKKIPNDAADLLTAYADNVIASLLNKLPPGSSC